MSEIVKPDTPPVALCADGGVMAVNPSPIGGTWAYCWLDAEGNRVYEERGVLTPEQAGLPRVSNNVLEFWAIAKALNSVPEGWVGHVYSDSENALIRWFKNAAMNGIPLGWVKARSRMLARLGNGITWTLLAGHPTKLHLETGRGHNGLPVHPANVWCDQACVEAAMEYARELGLDACEQILGKPYMRLREHIRRLEKAEIGTALADLVPMTALDAMEAIDPNFDAEPGEVAAPEGGIEIPKTLEEWWHICIDPHGHRFFYHPGKIEGPVIGNIHVTIELDEKEQELLAKPVRGQGGFQNLLRHLQEHCLKNDGHTLVMVKRTAFKVVKTAKHNRGDGGFQGRLARVAELAAAQLEGYRPQMGPGESEEELGGETS